MNALNAHNTNEIAVTTAMNAVLSSHFTPAEARKLRAEEGLLLGALAYYGEQQALVALGVFLFTPSMRDMVRDYLENTLEMLRSEAASINEEAEAFEYARRHEME